MLLSSLLTAVAGALQKLTINGNRLSSIAPELGQLSNLKDLQLQGNELTQLPEEICDLKVSLACIASCPATAICLCPIPAISVEQLHIL